MNSPNKTVIIIAGPTAVGKTSVAVEVADFLHTEIISADSRQCYKELNIGVARPTVHDLNKIPHHFIATHSIHDKITAASFEQYALLKSSEIFQQKDFVVVVGGTGLYIKAFCEGLDEIPDVDDAIRAAIAEEYKIKGFEWLQDEVKKSDPDFFDEGENKNPQRLMRALEVLQSSGKSILTFRKKKNILRPFNVIKFGLELPKEQLHQNIHRRVEEMLKEGLLEEVKDLVQYQYLNALQTVGYKELFSFYNGDISLEKAVEKIKTHTRQYAKRQMTWFKKDKEYKWMHPVASSIIEDLKKTFS